MKDTKMTASAIFNHDCLKVLPHLPDDCIDFTLFSPPYGSLRTYCGFPPLNLTDLGVELFRVAKEGSVCAVVIQDQVKQGRASGGSCYLVSDWLEDTGWYLYQTLIYQRRGVPGDHIHRRFRCDHEYIHVFIKGGTPLTIDKEPTNVPTMNAGKTFKRFRLGTGGRETSAGIGTVKEKTCRGSIWPYRNDKKDAIKSRHPAPFPDDLAADLIQTFTRPGDIVLDPMAGSGTTCVMAQRLKRRFIGIEISKEYCELIEQRLALVPRAGDQRPDTNTNS